MSVTACPGCALGDSEAISAPGNRPADATFELVLPGIHCAACIATVERVLNALPEIRSARVNLTRKRAWVAAEPGITDPSGWIEALADAGYEAHEASSVPAPDSSGSDLALHLGIAGFAMMNVMLLSVAVWSGAADATRNLMYWISAMIALPATAFAAQPFFRNAWAALRAGRLAMDVPISLAIILACGISLYETIEGGDHAWFEAALSLTFFLLAGRYLDLRMRQSVRSAASDLSALEPRRVHRIEGDARVSRPIEDIRLGDTLWLAAGARVPVDAVLVDDQVRVDRSALTGESDPIARIAGQDLVAGDVVLTGPVRIRATAVGEDTTLRRMTRLVAIAETARGRYSSLAEKAASIYTPAIHLIALVTFIGWMAVTGDIRQSLNVAVATLIITCPCALGLAIPAVSAAATGRLYRLGCLVKSDTALERLAQVDTVVFDKTGTLTRQELVVPGDMPTDARQVLRGLANASDHPLSRGLRATLRDVTPAALNGLAELPGKGIGALRNGQPVSLFAADDGRASILSIGETRYVLDRTERTVPGATQLITRLRGMGMDVSLLTGDAEDRAIRIGDELGISRVWASVPADGKVQVVKALRAEGRNVLMVGDGLNDAAALTAANASIAPGHALDISRNAADAVVTGDIGMIADVLRLATSARRRMLENLLISAGYNVVAIPLAVLGFASPLMAAVAMSTSSITVTLNALRTR
ncbi:heavy metal translocating P-type ATPase [Paracoccus sp. M683]|uniref:heavy metal translocating P-type ATPase n=1 Tax=Paracoccus sp. M683 TaxID=2594268 RepID=UPI00117C0E46|nr:heavy metal translocating P-type ATPase [Paracoccus sp. M683]TRW99559.1 heavy metal translocating P-type ATPase [Paracoccus sp. M683]